MRYLLLLFALFATPASAGEHVAFLGTWGTKAQCARTPVQPGGTLLSEPFEIGRNWLRQGQLWCALKWGPVEARENGAFTAANAQCGEDSERSYLIGMQLTGDELILRWNFPHKSGSLNRCPGS
ncbi:hypothetical protein [Labrenzia sp. DG1229]|uniref:hypothetical protein n=1 Tax=Labrenzia sp. DG1229 TaxID=681847 RepID=UPI0004919117|nr:hypothetical protein [Labrenzia sp. DG1229]